MEHKAEVTDVDEVTKKINVTVPASAVDEYLENEFAEVAKTVSLKGFRKGKAPRKMIEQLYGARIRMEVSRRLVGESLQQVITENEIHSVGEPELDFEQPVAGKDFVYTANVFLFPSPEISGYEGLDVEIESSGVTDEDVDKSLQSILESRAKFEKITDRDVAKEGDVIDAMLTVSAEGEEPGQPEPLVVGLGEGKLPEELEKGIVGMKIGETKLIEATIPEDHKNEELRGKKTNYNVELKAISEKVLPELTDALAAELAPALGADKDIGTVLELKIKLRENLEREKEDEELADTQARILEALLEKNDFAVPQSLVDNEIRNILVRYGLIDPKKMDVSQVPVDAFRENLEPEAKKRVQTSVLVDRIAEQEKLIASEEDIKNAIEEIAQKNNLPVDEVKQFFSDRNRAMSFTVEQTRNKVLEFLLSKTKVNKKKAA